MPKDTILLGNKGGSFILVDTAEKINEEIIYSIKEIYNRDIEFYKKGDGETTITFTDKNNTSLEFKVYNKTQFDKDVDSYNKIGDKLIFILLGLFCFTIYYAIKRLRRKKKNQLAEDSGWIEMGNRGYLD